MKSEKFLFTTSEKFIGQIWKKLIVKFQHNELPEKETERLIMINKRKEIEKHLQHAEWSSVMK